MSFIDCIRSKGINELITDTTFATIKREHEKMVAKYTETMGSEEAAIAAAEEMTNLRLDRAAEFKLAELKQIGTTAKVKAKVSAEYKRRVTLKASGKAGLQEQFGEATIADVVIDAVLEPAQRRTETVSRELFNVVDDLMGKHGYKWIETAKNTAEFKNLLGRMIDGDTIDPMAVSMRKAMDNATDMHTAAGGSMGKIENYAPQAHDARRVGAVTYEQWVADLEPRIDRTQFIDRETGLPMDDLRWAEVSRIMYDDIRTDGSSAIARNMNRKGKGRDIWNSRQNSRQIPFKDSENWFAYQEKYGVHDDDLLHSFTGHLSGMARDIGIMQTMGPMPTGMMRELDSMMEAAEVKAPYKHTLANAAFDTMVGGSDNGVTSPVYRVIMGAQNLLRSAMLGSASISALSDSVFLKLGTDAFGMNGTQAFKNYAAASLKGADRDMVSRSAHIMEQAVSSGINAFRLNEGSSIGSGGNKVERFLAWASKSVHRASGLQAMTEAAGDATSMELASNLARLADKKTLWMDLDDKFRRGLETNGINELDWEVIKKAPTLQGTGANYITPEQIARITDEPFETVMEVSRKVSDMDVMMRYLVTNTPRLRTRAISTAGRKHGSATRAAVSSVAMFKSFPMEVMQNYLLPSMAKSVKGAASGSERIKAQANLASMMIGTTIIGGVSLMIGDVIAGREPREIDSPKFALAAFLKGGSGSFVGDFLFADHDAFGRSYVTDFLGPMANLGTDVAKLSMGTLNAAFDEDKEAMDHLNKQSRDFLRKYVPAQSLWYARMMYEKMIMDGLDAMMSPNFQREMRKRNDRVEETKGNPMWWSHGSVYK